MSIFTRYAMDALMKTSHPEINRRQCWNLHPHRTPCATCKDICPYGDQIFTRPNLVKDWDPCTDCGLCVSACRSGCIAPSPEQVQRDTTPADNDNDTIWIGCEKSTRKNTITRLCISALSWEALAYLALSKKIVLDLTPCGECENDLCAEQLRKELTRLVEFFGPTVFEARFTLAYELEDAPYHVKELSRREMMEQLTEGSKSGTKKLLQKLPGLRDEEDAGMDFRLLLHQRTKQLKAAMETPLRYGYYLPNVTDKCFGCGKCEKSCRANALKVEDLPDGQTRIVVTPWKCGECGICVASCSNHGIDGMKLRQLTILLIVGMVMDTTPAILILTPILLPIVEAIGMNPIQFGVIMVVNLAIGFVTPPIGVNLFVASSLTDVPVMQIAKKAMPMIAFFLVALLLITFIPALSIGIL